MKRLPITALLAVFFGWLLWSVSVRQAALFAVGIGLGAVLAGKRFGFTTGWRMLVEEKTAAASLASCCCWRWLQPWPCLCWAISPS
jgi:hypothetical protein